MVSIRYWALNSAADAVDLQHEVGPYEASDHLEAVFGGNVGWESATVNELGVSAQANKALNKGKPVLMSGNTPLFDGSKEKGVFNVHTGSLVSSIDYTPKPWWDDDIYEFEVWSWKRLRRRKVREGKYEDWLWGFEW